MKSLYLSMMWFLLMGQLHAQRSAPEPFNVLHYVFELEVNDSTNIISGTTNISIQNTDFAKDSIHIDLYGKNESTGLGMTVSDVRVNGISKSFTAKEHMVTIPTPLKARPSGILELEIDYRGEPSEGLIISENKFGRRTFFGDNWPDRAHHWLPVVDHPADKATCEFIVTAPSHYQVIANGSLIDRTDLDDGKARTHWKESVPIPTKVMVIGVAEFSIQQQQSVNNIPVSSWVFPENKSSGFYDYGRAHTIMEFFVDLLGPYPFEKLAHVQSKTVYGGMENASNIFYYENSVNGLGTVDQLIAHETAHQWFGNSVSEQDWKDIWLSEGFATYLTQLYVEHRFGRSRMNTNMLNQKAKISEYIRMHPMSTVVPKHIEQLEDLLNANSYEKGGWILHMLRHQLGDEAFWKVLKEFYKKHKIGNASSKDFTRCVAEVSGKDFSDFFDQWLHKPGIPSIRYSWKFSPKTRQIRINLSQTGAQSFRIPLELLVRYPDGRNQLVTLRLTKKEETFRIPAETKPKGIVADPNIWLLAHFEKDGEN